MGENNPDMPCAKDPRTLDKIQFPAPDHLTADDPGKTRDKKDSQRQNDVVAPGFVRLMKISARRMLGNDKRISLKRMIRLSKKPPK